MEERPHFEATREWWLCVHALLPGRAMPGCTDVDWRDDESIPSSVRLRGPFKTCKDAVAYARTWRRRSPIYLVLAIDHRVKHCNRYRKEP